MIHRSIGWLTFYWTVKQYQHDRGDKEPKCASGFWFQLVFSGTKAKEFSHLNANKLLKTVVSFFGKGNMIHVWAAAYAVHNSNGLTCVVCRLSAPAVADLIRCSFARLCLETSWSAVLLGDCVLRTCRDLRCFLKENMKMCFSSVLLINAHNWLIKILPQVPVGNLLGLSPTKDRHVLQSSPNLASGSAPAKNIV